MPCRCAEETHPSTTPYCRASRPSLLPAAPLFQAFLGAARVQPARAHG